jgi:hypothetical protein
MHLIREPFDAPPIPPVPPTHRAVDLMEAPCFRSRKAVKGAPFGALPQAGFAP